MVRLVSPTDLSPAECPLISPAILSLPPVSCSQFLEPPLASLTFFPSFMAAVGYFNGGLSFTKSDGVITSRCHSQNGSRRQVAESHGD